jgi:hypothetical protein
MAVETRTFTATISRVNTTGFQIQERPGVWLNLSKYTDPRPTIPPVGTEVRITVDSSGFVRAIQTTREAPAPPPPTDHHEPPTKDTAIVRMASLKAAVRLTPPGADPTAVTQLAGVFEAWINR